jgi:hypothetical protein
MWVIEKLGAIFCFFFIKKDERKEQAVRSISTKYHGI